MEKMQSEKRLMDRMRSENYEHFNALVRMHLSFEIDMNIDEFDMPYHEIEYYEKGKLKKWNRFTKKIKSCTSSSSSSKINSPAENSSVQLTSKLIEQLRKLKKFLMNEENIKQEGIFRLTGSVSRQNELKSLINSGVEFNLENGYTVHDCATVFKHFLSNLPEPLLTDAHYPAHCQIAELCNSIDKNSSSNTKETRILHSIQLLLLLLPDENRTLFEDTIEMLNETLNYKEFNKMSASSLATLFSPHLICPRNLPPEALYYISQNMSKIIDYMINKGLQIFGAPPKLITDIRAYYLEQKRKKTMSPEQILDESISDLSTVNTVYTFVDREKTAAENNSNATDTALAQLYAYIQSLPESSKKRKLIRQFNKENGQGTPLQVLMGNKTKNEGLMIRSTKSITDSIKKHIFNKSIINKTPKCSNSNQNLLGFETPNAATKITKSRVLFQSPNCNNSGLINNQNTPIIKENLHKSMSSSSLLTTTKTKSISSTVTNKISLMHHHNSISLPSALNDNNITANDNNISSQIKQINNSTISQNNEIIKTTTGATTELGTNKTTENSLLKSLLIKKLNATQRKCTTTSNHSSGSNSNSSSCSNSDIDLSSASVCDQDYDNNCINFQEKSSKLKLKYKSEPNFNQICYDDEMIGAGDLSQDKLIDDNGSFSLNVRKCNSMNNIRSELDDNKNCSQVTDNLINEKQSSSHYTYESMNGIIINSPMYSERFENISSNNIYGGSKQQHLVTSTPSIFLHRKSISPITKSTQRMPKSMQESIMTPRSRKPVMLTTTLGSLEQSHVVSQTESSFGVGIGGNDDVDNDDDPLSSILHKNQIQQVVGVNNLTKDNFDKDHPINVPNSLTDTFREYLLSRKVLTISPEDSSFSSHSDDFGSGCSNIHDISEADLSESLLYCLNGNNPINMMGDDDRNPIIITPSTSDNRNNITQNCDVNDKNTDIVDVFVSSSSSSSRKRSLILQENDDNKENSYETNFQEKKINYS